MKSIIFINTFTEEIELEVIRIVGRTVLIIGIVALIILYIMCTVQEEKQYRKNLAFKIELEKQLERQSKKEEIEIELKNKREQHILRQKRAHYKRKRINYKTKIN